MLIQFVECSAETLKMPTLKLTYPNLKGRAEAIRLAFYIGGVEFEDYRIKHDDIPELKPLLPFQQLPVLTVDGKIIGQSYALLRYAGTLGKLYPRDPFQALLVDQIIFQIQDIENAIRATFVEKGTDKRMEIRDNLVKDIWPKQFDGLETVLATYGGTAAVGDSISIADIVIYLVVSDIKSGKYDGIPSTLLDSYSKVTTCYQFMLEHPKIKSWDELGKHNIQ